MQALTHRLLLLLLGVLGLTASPAAADTLFRSTAADETFTARAYPVDAPDRNLFIFTAPAIGHDTIVGFLPSRDRLIFRGEGMPRSWYAITTGRYEQLEDDTPNDVYSHLRLTPTGDTLIDLGPVGSITLRGVRPDALGADDVGFRIPDSLSLNFNANGCKQCVIALPRSKYVQYMSLAVLITPCFRSLALRFKDKL